MTTAFVLTGGGSLGAVQVGMLQALSVHGVEPDLLVGTSAGAMNAAWVSAHGTSTDSLARLAEIWIRLRRHHVFPIDVRTALRGVLGLSPAVVAADNLERLIAATAGIDLIQEGTIPAHLLAADLVTGQTVLLSTGPLVTGVLASAAIPGIFPPVVVNGRHLVDGGVADRTGVRAAVELGATEIYVLPTGTPCALPRPPSSAIGTALHAVTLLSQKHLAHEVAQFRDTVSIKLLPPLCPLATSAADFTHAADLIARSRRLSYEWIASGDIELPSPERFLATHRHRPATPLGGQAGSPAQRDDLRSQTSAHPTPEDSLRAS